MNERYLQMREFIMATERLNLAEAAADCPEPIIETSVSDVPVTVPVTELGDIVFKLRAFMESADGDYALGVESGMQRAADMIENLIRRYRGV